MLEKLESNNFNAYIIGGFVRDKLLGINSYDVDIVTNATPKDIISLFNVSPKNATNYGTIKIVKENYRFDIATFRKELSYKGRKPEVEYIDNLKDDIIRRDFTINTIAMNKNGEIIDYLNGIKDLQNKVIKSVDDASLKIHEDPLRILRALRFSIILDFKLDDYLLNEIKDNLDLIDTLSKNRIKEELDKILICKNALKGLDFLNKIGILKKLNITYTNLIDVDDLCGMYAQICIGDDYPFTKEEKNNIKNIKKIVKYGKIDNKILFNYGLYLSLVSSKILKLDEEDIVRMYNELPIKSPKDIAIKSDDIIQLFQIKPSKIIKKVNNELIDKILSNDLANNKDDIIKYIKEMNLYEI